MSHITMFDTVAHGHNGKESQFDPTAHCCPSPTCTGQLWSVQCLSARDQLWRVSSETDGSYLVAGVTPACPWCGATLSANGLLQPIDRTFQPEQAEGELSWN